VKDQIDLVVCAFNEEEMIRSFLEEVKKVVDQITEVDFHFLFVDDGSSDQTIDCLLLAQEADPRIVILELSRNFGHEAALAAGLEAVEGAAAIILDVDLQDPPSLIPLLLNKWREGFDVVNAKRISRSGDSVVKRWTASVYYRMMARLSPKIKIPINVGNFRLISKRVVDVLNSLPEKTRVFRILIPFLGYSTAEVPYRREARRAGHSHYGWSSMTRLAADSITSATVIPLKMAIRVGAFVATVGFAYLVYVIGLALFTSQTVSGWPSIMAVVLFLGGIQLLFLGLLGEYVGTIFVEVKGRPQHLVKKKWVNSGDAKTRS